MQTKKKKKKPEISADDTLRAFITVHVKEDVGELSASDRAALVDAVIGEFGDSITGIVKGAISLLTTEDEEDEDEDEEDEDEEDEDEDVE